MLQTLFVSVVAALARTVSPMRLFRQVKTCPVFARTADLRPLALATHSPAAGRSHGFRRLMQLVMPSASSKPLSALSGSRHPPSSRARHGGPDQAFQQRCAIGGGVLLGGLPLRMIPFLRSTLTRDLQPKTGMAIPACFVPSGRDFALLDLIFRRASVSFCGSCFECSANCFRDETGPRHALG